jgi:hypothetical protein
MTLLPIVERELRLAARARATYWIRLALGLIAIFLATCIFIVTFGMPPQQVGRYVFQVLAGLIFVYCLAYGRRSTADCLSQAKRQGTLGLLFLTDLKGHDVVLGKLAATSLRGFYGLLAVFPVLALPLLLGGITPGEFWRMALVLVVTFLCSLAIGMLGSAMSRELRRAMAANFLFLLLLWGVPPAIASAINYFQPARPTIRGLYYSCPVYAFYLCNDAQYKLASDHFWWSVGVIHGLTWALILLASWLARRTWQERPAVAHTWGWRRLWHRWSYGGTAGQRKFRKTALDLNAFYWLAGRARLKPVHVWTFLGFMAGWWLVGWATSGHLWLDPSVAVLTALLLNCTLKVWVAIEAGQQLAEDQRAGAFEAMLSSLLSVRDILRGQLLALKRQFLWPLIVVIAVELCFMWWLHRRLLEPFPVTWLAAIMVLLADVTAVSCVGMRRALTAKSHNHATISTVFRVLLTPWALLGVVVVVGTTWYVLILDGEWSPGWNFYLGLWFGFSLLTDLVLGVVAWRQLNSQFRQLALRRFHRSAAASAPTADVSREPPSRASRLSAPTAKAESGSKLTVAVTPGRSNVLQLFRKPPVLGVLAVLAIAAGLVLWKARAPSQPAMVIAIAGSNAPVRISSGGYGALIILPDGSLWHWGGPVGVAGVNRAAVPERIGTNHDWVQASAIFNRFVGLRSDGTVWDLDPYNKRGHDAQTLMAMGFIRTDQQVRWVAVGGGSPWPLALRNDGTLWTWTNGTAARAGGSSAPTPVGTNDDWISFCGSWSGSLGLRSNGTLWAWGNIPIRGSPMNSTISLSVPTQVCRETNWAGFVMGFFPLLLTRSGELWEPFHATPDSESPATTTCRLLLTNAAPGRVAMAMCDKPKLYQVRADGSLWETTFQFGSGVATPEEWRRVGKRSDWVSLFSGGGAAFGLTSDGVLWTWGFDLGRQPTQSFAVRLQAIQLRVKSMFGSTPGPMSAGTTPPYNQQPRPLLRLVNRNSTAENRR